jgi:drug/metabolite transporter (DMT)-like permease
MFQVKNGAHVSLVVGSILYGMTGLFLSHIHDMSIASIIFYRLFFGLCAISVFLIVTNCQGELKITKKRFLLLLQVILGLVSLILYFICIEKTCFSIAVLLQSTAPICVMLASPYILREKVGKESVVAIILAILGVYLVIHPNNGFGFFEFNGSYFLGVSSGILSGVLAAFCIMNIRILKRNYSEFAIAFWTTALCCLLMSPFAFETSLSVLSSNIFPLIASGVICVGVGGILTTIGYSNLKSQTGSLLSLIQLVAGVFFDLAVLGVTLPAGTIEGGFLVLIASVIVSFNDSAKFSVTVGSFRKIVEDYYKSLLRTRRWVLTLQILSVRNKKRS